MISVEFLAQLKKLAEEHPHRNYHRSRNKQGDWVYSAAKKKKKKKKYAQATFAKATRDKTKDEMPKWDSGASQTMIKGTNEKWNNSTIKCGRVRHDDTVIGTASEGGEMTATGVTALGVMGGADALIVPKADMSLLSTGQFCDTNKAAMLFTNFGVLAIDATKSMFSNMVEGLMKCGHATVVGKRDADDLYELTDQDTVIEFIEKKGSAQVTFKKCPSEGTRHE